MEVARGIQQEADANYSNDSLSGANTLILTASGNHQIATVAGTVMGPEGSSTDKDSYALGAFSAGNVIELGTRLPAASPLLPKVTLRDANGAVVADEDGDPLDGHVRATLAADGQYYAQVESSLWSYNGHVYRLTDTTGSWSQSEAQAQALGGHLVTIDDAVEQAWLTANFGSLANLWIGASDAAAEGTWRWTDGSTVSYSNWGSGEPSNQGNNSYDFAYMAPTGVGTFTLITTWGPRPG